MRGATVRLPLVALCACLALGAHAQGLRPGPSSRQAATSARGPQAQAAPPDGVTLLLQRIEQAVRAGSTTQYEKMIAAGTDAVVAAKFTESVIRPGVTRVVVRERDRAPLVGMPSGDGYRLAVDVFCEFGR